MSAHVSPTEQTYDTAADIVPAAQTATPASTPGEVWTVDRIRALGVSTTLATAASVLGISRSQAYRLAAADTFPAPLIRAGSRIIVPVAGLLRLLLVHEDPDTAPGGRRLDPGGEVSVDATTPPPADYARQRWRYRPEHPGRR